MNELIDILPQVLLKTGSGHEVHEQAARAAWIAAAGHQVSNVTAALRLENKTLIVAVTDETWRAQLRNISPQLVFKLNALLGQRCPVNRVEFTVNESAVSSAHLKPPTVEFTAPDEKASFLNESAAAMPPALGAALMRAAGKCLHRMNDGNDRMHGRRTR
jgi:predicted nucleic acid-binding Zn ribbon protein